MNHPMTLRSFAAAVAVASALAGCPAQSLAQSGWRQWDDARDAPPEASPYYDDRYGGSDDDRDDYYDDRYPPRANDRYAPDDDPRRYDPNYNWDDRYAGRPRRDRDRYTDRGYSDDRRSADPRLAPPRLDDRDDYGAWWDSAPSPEDERRLSQTPGREGGTKPDIRPVAPPVVAFNGPYAPGSIVIDTSGRKLYYVLNGSTAYAYPIGVGRQGFTWTGKEKVSRITDWPDWYPPADMRKRKPELPERMLGGIRNPLGAKAIYLGNTLYRIHGTNDPKSIGKAESSGCFRMMNENVVHLASLVRVGTEVTVVHSLNGNIASNTKAQKAKAKPAPPAPRIDDRDLDPYNGWH